MTNDETLYRSLMEAAVTARQYAYSPYSGYRVGAALLGKSGKIYTGCNVESASYTPTNCAERTAVFKAISEGEREFSAIAVAGGSGDGIDPACTPCGVCRQVLAEFCAPTTPVIMGTPDSLRVLTLEELLPFAFTSKNL